MSHEYFSLEVRANASARLGRCVLHDRAEVAQYLEVFHKEKVVEDGTTRQVFALVKNSGESTSVKPCSEFDTSNISLSLKSTF